MQHVITTINQSIALVTLDIACALHAPFCGLIQHFEPTTPPSSRQVRSTASTTCCPHVLLFSRKQIANLFRCPDQNICQPPSQYAISFCPLVFFLCRLPVTPCPLHILPGVRDTLTQSTGQPLPILADSYHHPPQNGLRSASLAQPLVHRSVKLLAQGFPSLVRGVSAAPHQPIPCYFSDSPGSVLWPFGAWCLW